MSGSKHRDTFAEKFKTVYAKSCNLVPFGRKMVLNAVHNAFLNTLTVGTLLSCVPSAFQQLERRCHTFPLEMTHGDPATAIGGHDSTCMYKLN